MLALSRSRHVPLRFSPTHTLSLSLYLFLSLSEAPDGTRHRHEMRVKQLTGSEYVAHKQGVYEKLLAWRLEVAGGKSVETQRDSSPVLAGCGTAIAGDVEIN